MRASSCILALVLAATSAYAQAAAPASGAPAAQGGAPAMPPGVDVQALTKCATSCTEEGAKKADCKDGAKDLSCWCKSQKFGDAAADCVSKNCAACSMAFIYPQYQQQCGAAKQDVTFKWPNVTASASASGAAGAAAPGAGAPSGGMGAGDMGAANTSTTPAASGAGATNGNPPAPAAPAKNGAGVAAGLVWPAVLGLATVSAGAALLA